MHMRNLILGLVCGVVIAVPQAYAQSPGNYTYIPTQQDRHEISQCVIAGGVGTQFTDCIMPVINRIMFETMNTMKALHDSWPTHPSQVVVMMRLAVCRTTAPILCPPQTRNAAWTHRSKLSTEPSSSRCAITSSTRANHMSKHMAQWPAHAAAICDIPFRNHGYGSNLKDQQYQWVLIWGTMFPENAPPHPRY
jgi:hypothetical protein